MTAQTAQWLDEITQEELETDPYPIFARLREEAPLAWIPVINGWMASTWDMCSRIANSPDSFRGGHSGLLERVIGSSHVLNAEGDLHRQLRKAIDPEFKPRVFKPKLEDAVRPIARAHAAALRDRAELMADYFEPISVRCVGDAMGFRDVPTETLRRWFHDLASGMANVTLDPGGFARADAAKAEIAGVARQIAASVAAHPDEGVISHWLHDDMPDGRLRDLGELDPTLYVLLLGGLQEPGHTCGSTFYGLASQPHQLERVIAEPKLLSKAIAEGLRWIAPIFSGTTRLAVHDVTIDGQTVRQGQTLWLNYGSANRDTTRFERPEVFDLDRPSRGHLAFGLGRHACAGAAFGPQLARIALEELLAAHPDVRLDPSHEVAVWGWVFRGVTALHVTL